MIDLLWAAAGALMLATGAAIARPLCDEGLMVQVVERALVVAACLGGAVVIGWGM